MAKTQSPLLGYNNNVRHKNRVFHIQTEDSGVKHPHVITHLFMDGGRILKSVKRSYAEHLGSDNLSETVRQMMKEQHKQMFIALRDGAYDDLLEGAVRASTAGIPAQAAKPPAPAQASAAPPAQAAQAAAPAPAAPAAPPQAAAPPPQPAAASRTESPIDMQALEAASLTTGEHAALVMPNDLPPPPKNLFQKELTGNIGYRSTRVDEEEAGRPTPAQQKRPGSRPPPERHGSQPAPDKRNPLARTQPSVAPSPPSRVPPAAPPASPAPAPAAARPPAPSLKPPPQPAVSLPPPTQKDDPAQSRRYAPARPAAIFGQSQAPSTSIFGDDLVGDKSLDEVILSYLVDDLNPQKK